MVIILTGTKVPIFHSLMENGSATTTTTNGVINENGVIKE